MVAQRENNSIKIRTIYRETIGTCIQTGLALPVALTLALASLFCTCAGPHGTVEAVAGASSKIGSHLQKIFEKPSFR